MQPDKEKQLYDAALKGNKSEVMRTLSQGIDINRRLLAPLSVSILHAAARGGHLDLVKVLLSKGAKPDITDMFDRTPLSIASSKEYEGIVEFLLTRESGINKANKSGYTPLHEASRYKHRRIAEMLIAHGARTDLFVASALNDVEMAESLVENGADVNSPWIGTAEGVKPLHWAAEFDSTDVAIFLLDHGADIEAVGKSGYTPLMVAAQHNSLNAAKLLVQRGADINHRAENRYIALHLAVLHGTSAREIAKMLIAHGGEVDILIAAGLGDIPTVELLLSSGIDIHSRDHFEGTPLHWAVMNAQVKMVEFLISKGADVNAEECELETPLHAVSCSEEGISTEDVLKVAEILIAHGANINAENRGDCTPLYFAAHRPELVELLRSHGGVDAHCSNSE